MTVMTADAGVGVIPIGSRLEEYTIFSILPMSLHGEGVCDKEI